MRTRRGFTLIELLVVIAIIALLMAIMIPALGRVKKQAQSVTCRARLKEWGLLFKLYTDDYDGSFNPGWDVGEVALWMNTMRPYYKDTWDMLLCPTATRVVESANDWGTFKAQYRNIPLPGGGNYTYNFSYGINSWTNHMTKDRGGTHVRRKEEFWKIVHNISDIDPVTLKPNGRPVSTNNIPVLADSTWHDAWPRAIDTPPPYPDASGWGSTFSTGTADEMWQFCIERHSGFVNFVFMDWSVRPVGLKECWTLKWHRGYNTAGPWTKAGRVRAEDWPQWLRRYKDY